MQRPDFLHGTLRIQTERPTSAPMLTRGHGQIVHLERILSAGLVTKDESRCVRAALTGQTSDLPHRPGTRNLRRAKLPHYRRRSQET